MLTLIRVKLIDNGDMGKTTFLKKFGKSHETKDEKYVLTFSEDPMNRFNEDSSDVAMILFDNSEPGDTLENAQKLMKMGRLPKILCGSKLDISERIEDLEYFPYSAVTGEGIQDIYDEIVKVYEKAYKDVRENPYVSQPSYVTEST